VKHGRSLALVFWFVPICSFGAAQTTSGKPASPIEIVAIRNHGIDVKLRSVWSYPVSVWVCDTPRRLNELGYYLEAYSGKNWKRLEIPEGRHFGDLKPEYLEIGEGRTDSVPASIYPEAFGGSSGMKLRIVIRAWRTERDSLGLVHTISQESLLLTSAPFVLKARQGNSQQ
jgi:hypothetical protein